MVPLALVVYAAGVVRSYHDPATARRVAATRRRAVKHDSTPAELKARLEAERRGTPFVELRDGDGQQLIVELDAAAGRVTVGRRADNASPCPGTARSRACTPSSSRSAATGCSATTGCRATARTSTAIASPAGAGCATATGCASARPRCASARPRPTGSLSTAAVAIGRTDLPLTETQRKLLVALCRPLQESAYATPATNREIADEVHLSVDAVKAHLRVLFERLGLDDLPQNQKRARLAAVALVDGLVHRHDF